MWILLSQIACSPDSLTSVADSRADVAPGAFQAVLNPLLEGGALTPTDPSSNKRYGDALALGDLNGDGHLDLAVGARGDSDRGYNAGAVYLYYGSATGLDTTEHKLLAEDGDSGHRFGEALAADGDVDGDGYGDLVVSAPGVPKGALYVFYGGVSGISAANAEAVQRNWGGSSDGFGATVRYAGDVDADGQDEVLAGAADANSAVLFFGDAEGLGAGAQSRLEDSAGGAFGSALAAGDLDADGYSDVVIGDPEHSSGGLAHIHYGSVSGLSSTRTQSLAASDLSTGDAYAASLVVLRDVDGDGYPELAVGSSSGSSGPNSGAVYVYTSNSAGPQGSSEQKLEAADGGTGQAFGGALSTGDVDGDGHPDLAVGALYATGAEASSGAVYIHFGSATGLERASQLKRSASDGSSGAAYSQALAAGDLDGDGHSELWVGAPGAQDGGVAYVYQGGCRDQDEDGVCTSEGDCLDLDPSAFPGAADLPGDGVDSDCDGQELCFADPDGDGVGDGTTVVSADSDCADPGELGTEAPSGDCDPNSESVYPGAEELIADGIDQDCDGGDLCYADGDADGFADQSKTQASTDLDCEDTTEASATQPAGDCADDNPAIHPEAEEICDGLDNDCDDAIDLNAVDQGTWYPDVDEDGFGDPEGAFTDCFAPFAYIDDNTDCDDADPQSYPGAPEIEGDGVDQDCDGADAALPPEPEGCGCSSTQGPSGIALWPLLLLLGGLLRRRS